MAKRKLGASVIILCIAAITLVSGTYAWFLVGGSAKLFDLGFGVIEANAALELKGDDSNSQWKDALTRDDFTKFSFITDKTDTSRGGFYRPVSSKDGVSFVSVGMDGNIFKSDSAAPIGKATATDGVTDPNDVCYNDFTFYIRSKGEEIVASGEHGAYMTIELGAYEIDEETKELKPKADDDGAAHAARVAVSIGDGVPVLYDIDGETGWNAVTSKFTDGSITDADPYNQIIDTADPGSGNAGLTPVSVQKLIDADKNAVKIFLGNIPNSTSSGQKVHVQIWLEGNDQHCIDVTKGEITSIAGKNLLSKLSFGVAE